MQLWINILGYQIIWLITVTGAAHGRSWPAWAASAFFCGGYLASSPARAVDARLIALAVILGALLDGGLASSGLIDYSPATPSVPLFGSPLWIVALWAAFSMTLTRSLGWLRGRMSLTLLFGGVGGPLAYWAASRGWGVIAFSPPLWKGVLGLMMGWAVALAILVSAAARAAAPEAHRASQEEAEYP